MAKRNIDEREEFTRALVAADIATEEAIAAAYERGDQDQIDAWRRALRERRFIWEPGDFTVEGGK